MPRACPVEPSRSPLLTPLEVSAMDATGFVPWSLHAGCYPEALQLSRQMPRACPVEPSRSPLLTPLEVSAMDATGFVPWSLHARRYPEALQLSGQMPRACPVEPLRSPLRLQLLYVFANLCVCQVSVRSHISTVHPETVHTRLHHLIQHHLLSRIHQRRCNRCRRHSGMTL